MNLYLRHLDSAGGDKTGGMGKMMGGDNKQDASKSLSPEQKEQVSALIVAMNNNLSMILLKQKKYKQAAAASSQVIERDSSNSKANFNRAKAHALLGDTDSARRDLLNCDPEDPQVQQIVARVEALEKKAEKAQKKKLAGMFDKMAAQEDE
eukprot:TRINITY_DN4207_c0_g1_i2.p1 TRINITY_DN4207_c0_g1~~TRINITY_DN4207_c0_g1_i2.p1  ORF type:complete len:151 (-),score=68.84 TRINITY_DN4207_c0_g1_i2:290-742(-)